MRFPLSATTTEAELLAPVAAARERLARSATAHMTPSGQVESLTDQVNDVWAEEALSRVRHEIVQCLKHHEESTPEARSAAVCRLFVAILSRSADDQWSGRKNDGRRAAGDAVRKEIADQRWALVTA